MAKKDNGKRRENAGTKTSKATPQTKKTAKATPQVVAKPKPKGVFCGCEKPNPTTLSLQANKPQCALCGGWIKKLPPPPVPQTNTGKPTKPERAAFRGFEVTNLFDDDDAPQLSAVGFEQRFPEITAKANNERKSAAQTKETKSTPQAGAKKEGEKCPDPQTPATDRSTPPQPSTASVAVGKSTSAKAGGERTANTTPREAGRASAPKSETASAGAPSAKPSAKASQAKMMTEPTQVGIDGKRRVMSSNDSEAVVVSEDEESHPPIKNPKTVTCRSPTGLGALLKSRTEQSAPHMVVRAYAGTGKTFTQIMGVAYAFGQGIWPQVVKHLGFEPVPSAEQRLVWESLALSAGKVKTVTYTAFNKTIVTEFQDKWGWLVNLLQEAGITLAFSTINSLGHGVVTKWLGRGITVADWHAENVLSDILGVDGRELKRKDAVFVKATTDLVALCKLTLAGWSKGKGFDPAAVTEDVLDRLTSHYDVEMEGLRYRVYDMVPQVLGRCADPMDPAAGSGRGEIDYNDQNWLPIVKGLPVPQSDLLLVDEGQDLPRCKQEYALLAGKRIVLVGDVRQAIYGFAGADTSSIPNMEARLGILTCPRCWTADKWQTKCATCKGTGYVGGVRLQLTQTRRCGKAIVEEARKIVHDFTAHESNPPGHVGTMYEDQYASRVRDKDMVLCRVNAPLVANALRFIKAGRKAVIRGRDFGGQLINFVEARNASDVPDLITKTDHWLAEESRKERAKRNPSEERIIALQDRRDCIIAFTDGAANVSEVRNKIELVFAGKHCEQCGKHYQEHVEACFNCQRKLSKPEGVLFSSIHRAKGLEADRVFFLVVKGAECPHPMAKQEWQVEQEWNCKYIAITRAINELWYVISREKAR